MTKILLNSVHHPWGIRGKFYEKTDHFFLCIVLAVTAVGCDTKDTDQPSDSVSQSASEVPSGDDTLNLPSTDSDRGLLSLYVVVKDESGRLICDDRTVASNKLAKNEQGLFQGTFGLPVDANAKSYTISFRER